MSVRRIDDSALTAIANAIRAKTGSTETMKVGDMPTEIAAIEGGSSLPSGITVGSFTCPSGSYPALGNFTITHELGKVPRAVLVWKTTELYNNTISGMVCFSHETTCALYDGIDCTEVTGSVSSSLTDTTFLVPSASGTSASNSVWIGTYNWAAIG